MAKVLMGTRSTTHDPAGLPRSRGRDRANRRAWTETVNGEASSEGARLTYEGAIPFGGEVIHRWRLGNGLAVAVSNAWYPDTRTVTDNIDKLTLQLATDSFSNVLKEFWPDVKRRLQKKHAKPDPAH